MTLNQLLREGIKGWHGVKLNHPTGAIIRTASPSVPSYQKNPYWSISSSMPIGSLLTSNFRGGQRVKGSHGDDGSTLFKWHPKTLWRGNKHLLFLSVRIGPALGL